LGVKAVKLSHERVTSRQGVNAAQAFFERHGCVFQEVAQQNDFGKDAYVDVGENGIVTFLCAALQIKSGTSYRAAKGKYFIPIDGHAENWRQSTIPVFGLVYDVDDGLIRWTDLTGHLRAHPDTNSGSIPVSGLDVLTEVSLRCEFKAALQQYAFGGFGAITLNLLSAGALQTDAVFDAWALGRHDAKYLLVLRRVILELHATALRRAIYLLSHAGSHPDIFWTRDNWIPQNIEDQILPSFRWSPEELARMLTAVGPEEWGRGTLGQCLDVLLYEDSGVVAKLHIAIGFLLRGEQEITHAVRGATLALTHSRDQRSELSALVHEHPILMTHEWFQSIALAVEESGDLSLY
jgi:hypothetical protein